MDSSLASSKMSMISFTNGTTYSLYLLFSIIDQSACGWRSQTNASEQTIPKLVRSKDGWKKSIVTLFGLVFGFDYLDLLACLFVWLFVWLFVCLTVIQLIYQLVDLNLNFSNYLCFASEVMVWLGGSHCQSIDWSTVKIIVSIIHSLFPLTFTRRLRLRMIDGCSVCVFLCLFLSSEYTNERINPINQ